MKQLLILSGKGGTGKTTVAGGIIKLSKAGAFADCDVDAPNLHLLINRSDKPQKSDFYGMAKAVIDQNRCLKCGVCKDYCRFDAIEIKGNNRFEVATYACEGCGVCEMACPNDAISLVPNVAGGLELFMDNSVFSTATLKMGSGNSGKLVSQVKKQMIDNSSDKAIAIIDGSPGIGCPVIASMSGVDAVLIVTEPTISGISDMERVIKTAKQFQVEIFVCINKFDVNLINTKKIEDYCKYEKIVFVGKIPFDKEACKAINSGLSIVDVDCPAGRAVKEIYSKLLVEFYDNKNAN